MTKTQLFIYVTLADRGLRLILFHLLAVILYWIVKTDYKLRFWQTFVHPAFYRPALAISAVTFLLIFLFKAWDSKFAWWPLAIFVAEVLFLAGDYLKSKLYPAPLPEDRLVVLVADFLEAPDFENGEGRKAANLLMGELENLGQEAPINVVSLSEAVDLDVSSPEAAAALAEKYKGEGHALLWGGISLENGQEKIKPALTMLENIESRGVSNDFKPQTYLFGQKETGDTERMANFLAGLAWGMAGEKEKSKFWFESSLVPESFALPGEEEASGGAGA